MFVLLAPVDGDLSWPKAITICVCALCVTALLLFKL